MTDGSKNGSSKGDYSDEVRRLFDIGESEDCDPEDWPDYSAEFGLGSEHIPDLIRLACDTQLSFGSLSDGDAVWAPMHAWRALGQMRAEEAVIPLLAVSGELSGDDAGDEELPHVFGMIGPPAIPHIAAYLATPANVGTRPCAAIDGIRRIIERHPQCRGEGIELLTTLFQDGREERRLTNGFGVSTLIDLRAVEAIDAIRDAFQRDIVDISIAGDMEDVEINLGLRTRRSTRKPNYLKKEHGLAWFAPGGSDRGSRQTKEVGRNDPCPCGSGKKYKKCCLP